MWAWGHNTNGQLGNGDSGTDPGTGMAFRSPVPVQVVGITDARAIAAGNNT